MNIENLENELKEKYSRFCTHLRRNWINVLFHEQVAQILEMHCQNTGAEKFVTDEISPIRSEKQANIRLKNKDLLNFIKSSTGAGSEWAFEWTLVSSIALFEAFVSDIAELIYRAKPNEFLLDSKQPDSQQINLKLILDATTKEEAIAKYIEQKLMGIFYGNPSEAFVKYNSTTKKGVTTFTPSDGKLKLDTGVYLHRNCKAELEHYVEMTKRRNVIVHNAGIINSRYIEEVPDGNSNKLTINSKVKVDRSYLFSSINALYIMARFYCIRATYTAYKIDNLQENEDEGLLNKLKKQFK